MREIGKKHCKSSVTYFLLNKKPPVKQVVFLFTLSKPAGLDSVNCPMQAQPAAYPNPFPHCDDAADPLHELWQPEPGPR